MIYHKIQKLIFFMKFLMQQVH